MIEVTRITRLDLDWLTLCNACTRMATLTVSMQTRPEMSHSFRLCDTCTDELIQKTQNKKYRGRAGKVPQKGETWNEKGEHNKNH